MVISSLPAQSNTRTDTCAAPFKIAREIRIYYKHVVDITRKRR